MALARYQRLRRLALSAIILAAVAALLFVRSSWDGEAAHEVIEVVGLGLIVVGIIGRMWCTLYIGGRKSAQIVRAGPYSITRNPLYVFSSIAAAGLGAQTGSITIAAVFLIGCALAFHVVIRKEESFLRKEFGQIYENYLSTVPRFLPNPSLFEDNAELTIQTRLVYTTLIDGLVFFAAMPVFETIEVLQDSLYLPVLLHLP